MGRPGGWGGLGKPCGGCRFSQKSRHLVLIPSAACYLPPPSFTQSERAQHRPDRSVRRSGRSAAGGTGPRAVAAGVDAFVTEGEGYARNEIVGSPARDVHGPDSEGGLAQRRHGLHFFTRGWPLAKVARNMRRPIQSTRLPTYSTHPEAGGFDSRAAFGSTAKPTR